jgi:stage II sporulation protein D
VNIFVLGTILLASFCFAQNSWFFSKQKIASIKAPSTIRVLLHELKGKKSLVIKSKGGFLLETLDGKKQTIPDVIITICWHQHGIMINKIPYKNTINLNPLNGIFSTNQRTYRGKLRLILEKNKIFVVNTVSIEEYVYCVLKTESWPGWPLETNKTLAITCRTYAISKALEARSQKKLYDVTDTNKFQTYHGIHKTPVIAQALKDTQGIIIAHNNQPILAMYDSCCGGVIPSRIETINQKKTPYLARTYACPYCKNCPAYHWQTSMPITHLCKKIPCNEKYFNTLVITKKDRAGLVQELLIKGKGISMTITGNKTYSFSNTIKSFYFDTQKKGNSIVFKGRGLGHHIGLCQWGAHEMTKKGFNYKQILQYYYPTTKLVSII